MFSLWGHLNDRVRYEQLVKMGLINSSHLGMDIYAAIWSSAYRHTSLTFGSSVYQTTSEQWMVLYPSYIPLLGGIAAFVGKENGQEFLLLKQTPLYGKMLAFYLKVLLEHKNCVPPFNLSSCTSLSAAEIFKFWKPEIKGSMNTSGSTDTHEIFHPSFCAKIYFPYTWWHWS